MKKIETGYSLHACPPLREAVPLSLQQLLLAILNVLPVPLLIGSALGFSADEMTILLAGCLFVTGIGTLLQTIGFGPVGARLPIILMNSFVFVAPGIALGSQYGIATFTGACLVGSIVTLLLWTLFHKQLSHLFKPYITGSVVMVLGISLCSVAIDYCAGGNGASDYGDPVNLLLAFGTVLIMLILSRYGKNFWSRASAFVAIIIMSIFAAFFGKLDLTAIAEAAWFRAPQPLYFGIEFQLGPIITISVLSFVALVEILGDQAAAAMIAENRLPTSKESKGGIIAQGISSLISALFNNVPTISGSANIGLVGISGVPSRFVIAICGFLLTLSAFIPKFSAILSSIPAPVLGGIALTAFGKILLSGMDIIRNTKLTNRTTIIVGISLAIGIGFSMVPGSLTAFPSWVSSLLGGVPGTAITAILFSYILREESTEEAIQEIQS